MIYEKTVLDVPYKKGGVSGEKCRAVITAIVPDVLEKSVTAKKRTAVIICPGGGYDYCSVREAEPVAIRFAAYGTAAFVLDYSCVKKPFPTNLLELAAAFEYVNNNAERFGIDADRIYVCGFSAGGHLAASLAVYYKSDFLTKAFNSVIKPAGAVLCYPVITSGKFRHDGSILNLVGENPTDEALEKVSLEKQVNADTVPVFIWHTTDDNTVPVENTIDFIAALARYNISFECHIFQSGVHGLALGDECTANYDGHINSDCAKWFSLALEWIKK